MSSLPSAACTHDLGPGTTVCLRCRQEQRDADRARQARLLGMGGVAALGLLGLYALGASAASAWHTTPLPAPAHEAPRVFATGDVKQQGDGTPSASAATRTLVQAVAPIAPAASVPSPTPAVVASHASPPLSLIVPQGRTVLPDSVYIDRGGDTVVVDFDTDDARTRRRDKFERVLRETLPVVYGARVDSVLAAIPQGSLVTGDLLGELPVRGLHVPLTDRWTLDLWPETRPGRDGPLVVRYRARVVKG